MKKSVICPVYDEGEVTAEVCRRLEAYFDLVVIVDDGSPTPVPPGAGPKTRVLRHRRNRGKGSALATGFAYCLERGADIVATIDGDGEHDPDAFGDALGRYRGEGLLNLSRAPYFGQYTWMRRGRNVVFSHLVSSRIGTVLADTQSGMRIFSREAVADLLDAGVAPGYAVETAALIRLADRGFRIVETDMTSIGPVRPGRRYPSFSTFLSDVRLLSEIAVAGLVSPLSGTVPHLPPRSRAERYARR